jgi:hypothetical protein
MKQKNLIFQSTYYVASGNRRFNWYELHSWSSMDFSLINGLFRETLEGIPSFLIIYMTDKQ